MLNAPRRANLRLAKHLIAVDQRSPSAAHCCLTHSHEMFVTAALPDADESNGAILRQAAPFSGGSSPVSVGCELNRLD